MRTKFLVNIGRFMLYFNIYLLLSNIDKTKELHIMIYTQQYALEALKDFSKRSPEEFRLTIDELNKRNFVAYLDGAYFEVRIAEHWSEECSDYMTECGYNGQEIWTYSKYYGESTPGEKYKEDSDFLYVLFASDLYEHDMYDVVEEDKKNYIIKEAEKDLDSIFADRLKSRSNN